MRSTLSKVVPALVLLATGLCVQAGPISAADYKQLPTRAAEAGPIDGLVTYSDVPMEAENHLSSSSPAVGGGFNGLNIGTVIGAGTYYSAGYTGSRAVAMNIEAGHLWSGHETLGHVTQFVHDTSVNAGTQTGEVDRHATWVSQAIGGRLVPAGPNYHQTGIAPDATLWSGAVATNWGGTPYSLSFGFNTSTLNVPFETAFVTGIGGRQADVVNGSWGNGSDTTAQGFWAVLIDAYAAANPQTTPVFSAGNSGPGGNTVGSPGSGYNTIAVGALGADTDDPAYRTTSSFSSRGPQDYWDPVNGLVADARAVVDISAPGQNLTLAYYGGATGGNSASLGTPVGVTSDNFLYSLGIGGTSFSAPITAAAFTLAHDVAYDRFPGNPMARDTRVLKAIMLNAATKTNGWTNNTVLDSGVLVTGQALDLWDGAGALNLDRAFTQQTAGTTDLPGVTGGTVDPIGWDYGEVSQGSPTDYLIDGILAGGSSFTATLNWFRDRRIVSGFTFSEDSQDDLDLELWLTDGNGTPTSLVAASYSTYNLVEHIFVPLPVDGEYLLRVNWFGEIFDTVADANVEQFGVAWESFLVPEPTTLLLLAGGTLLMLPWRRKRTA